MKNLTKSLYVFIILTILNCGISFSQTITQTIKGRVIDKESLTPLPGASIVIQTASSPLGVASDSEGFYQIDNVPVGRHTIVVTFMGYEPMFYSEVLVGSGKEVVINVELTESIAKIDDVVVKGNNNKGEPINSMSMNSARSFNVEETRRYAGGFDDPVRLASVYAGVASSGSVESNAIMIRGNSPVGVLWQVEGMTVPNPTHFANSDILGGGSITMFSNQILSNSDFYTGAFPAEFGNAYSGAFDVRFRDGNTDKFEHAFQIGAMGIDFASEGPLSHNKKTSYLFNYRYSTLGLLAQFLPEGEGLPIYQDLSFKIKLPAGEGGYLSIWGVGGIDIFAKNAEEDSTEWTFEQTRKHIRSDFKSGTVGMTYRKLFNNDSYLNISVAGSGYFQENNAKWLNENLEYNQLGLSKYLDTRYSTKILYNKKHNARLTTRIGVIYEFMAYNYELSVANQDYNEMIKVSDVDGNSSMVRAFAQAKYSITQNLTLNTGLHSMYFQLNDKMAVEPRLGLKWEASENHSFSASYGIHSQQQYLSVYFVERQTETGIEYPNKDLDFNKAQHFVLGYDLNLGKNHRIRVEPYYQILSNLAVVNKSPIAMINVENLHDFNLALVSTGKGRNYGVDFTFERFLNKGFYYLLTSSVFESKFTGGDGIERDTRFNNNFLVNALAGKEWKIGKNKNQIFSLNARVYVKGGDRLTPPDEEASRYMQAIEFDENRAFEEQAATTYRVDFTVNYQINLKKFAIILSTQVNNILESPTIYKYVYDYTTSSTRVMQDGKSFPNMSLKIEF